jgi:hypothetical protein
MGTPTSETHNTIETLLQQRAQFEQWLIRLDSAGEKAPPVVRQRVRADYEGRLKGVIDELRGHSATINEELERHRGSQAEFDRERREAEEGLAEAEVRHVVGEYSEDEWRRISDDSKSNLGRLREQLRIVGDEIARLAEVQSLIAATPQRVAPAPASQSAAKVETPEPPAPPVPEPALAIEPDLVIEHDTPHQTPSPAAASRPASNSDRETVPAGPPGDELAFLKSVSEEERKPGPRRPSNPGGGSSGQGAARTAEASSATATSHGGAAGKTATPTGAKTLKCAECGTLNRPTEWYCERCGGELAGL